MRRTEMDGSRSVRAARPGVVILSSLLCALFSPAALADFSGYVAFAPWHLWAFLLAVIVLPLSARPGRRLFWFISVVLGYPLSFALLSKLASWVDTAQFAQDPTVHVLMLITWGWIFCVQLWLRLTRSQRARTLSFESPAPGGMTIAADAFVLVTIIAVLIESQALLVHLTHLDLPVIVGSVIVCWALAICSAAGVWRRRRWAWLPALVSSASPIYLVFILMPEPARFADPSLGPLGLAVEHPVFAALGLRVAGLVLLFIALSKRARWSVAQ